MFKKISVIIAATMLAASLTACSSGGDGSSAAAGSTSDSAASTSQSIINTANNADTSSTTVFTERDMTQSVDTSDSKTITIKDAEIIVDAADDAKVQLVLNGVTLTNSSLPCVYVKNADKVFVTTQKGTTNALSVTGAAGLSSGSFFVGAKTGGIRSPDLRSAARASATRSRTAERTWGSSAKRTSHLLGCTLTSTLS